MLRKVFLFILIVCLESVLRKRRLLGRQCSSIRCYFLLFSLLYCSRHRELWHKRGQHMRLVPTGTRQHIFIYQSFVFNKRSHSEKDGAAAVAPLTFIVLFLANKNHWIHDSMLCMWENAKTGQRRRMAARKELISSLGICALDLYVLACSAHDDDGGGEGEEEKDNSHRRYNVILREPNQIGWRVPTKLQLEPRQADLRPRKLVLCISRVFAFERWQLLLTALEAYRLFRVDLVVAHVQSALTAVFKLMQAYEREGLVSIRPGIRFPHTIDMPWDPNAETEFNGQILLAHECFYEFRQSAAFIGLIDWDDLLLPSRHFSTLPSAFSAASRNYPDAAYFLVNKLEANFVTRTNSPKQFNLRHLMEKGILAAPMYNDEKLVVLPQRVRGFWMHHSRLLEPKFRPIQLLTNYSIMLHLANEERVEPDEFQMPLLRRFNITEMDRHARAILAHMDAQNVLNALPRSQPYFKAIAECHRLIFAYYKSIGTPSQAHCLSYSLCELPRVERECTVVRSTFRSALSKSGRHGVHVRTGSRFVQHPRGCVMDFMGGI